MLRRKLLHFCLPLVLFLLLPLLAAYFALMAGGKGPGQKARDLQRENRLLETIIGLATKESSYLILDMRKKSDAVSLKIELQHRGMVLKQFPIDTIRVRRTKGLSIEPLPLIRKAAFSPPKRKEVKPYKPEDETDANGELEFLELKDFPSHYSLSFGRRLRISIIGKTNGLISWFPRTIRAIFVHLRNSFSLVWNYVVRNDFTVIEISMEQKDAQVFYWSLEEGMKIVVIER